MRNVKIAAIQMQCSTNLQTNLEKAEKMVRQAAGDGAQIILLPELFEREYFCQQRRYDFYHLAKPVEENDAVQMGMRLAKELNVVLPISFYEQDINPLPALMRTAHCRGCIVRHIFRMIIIIRKSFILHRGIPASKYLIPVTAR